MGKEKDFQDTDLREKGKKRKEMRTKGKGVPQRGGKCEKGFGKKVFLPLLRKEEAREKFILEKRANRG